MRLRDLTLEFPITKTKTLLIETRSGTWAKRIHPERLIISCRVPSTLPLRSRGVTIQPIPRGDHSRPHPANLCAHALAEPADPAETSLVLVARAFGNTVISCAARFHHHRAQALQIGGAECAFGPVRGLTRDTHCFILYTRCLPGGRRPPFYVSLSGLFCIPGLI